MNQVITQEVRLFAEKLPFGKEGRSEGLAVFEQTRRSCVEEDDYTIVLTILSFSEGRPKMEHVCDFLEECFSTPFEEARKLAAAFPLMRALKTPVGKERLLPLAEKLLTQDPSEAVRQLVAAALELTGLGRKAEPRLESGEV